MWLKTYSERYLNVLGRIGQSVKLRYTQHIKSVLYLMKLIQVIALSFIIAELK